jgi:hypothetical protein
MDSHWTRTYATSSPDLGKPSDLMKYKDVNRLELKQTQRIKIVFRQNVFEHYSFVPPHTVVAPDSSVLLTLCRNFG